MYKNCDILMSESENSGDLRIHHDGAFLVRYLKAKKNLSSFTPHHKVKQ